MLSNAYFLAKFRFDTAENEPAKNLQNFRKMHFRKMHFSKNAFSKNACALLVPGVGLALLDELRGAGEGRLVAPERREAAGEAAQPRPPRAEQRASVDKISAKCCSFSAVSAPIFARKYAFCSIFQNLPDSQAEIFEI